MENVLKKNKIPNEFFKICREFLEPNISNQNKINEIVYPKNIYTSIILLETKVNYHENGIIIF